MIKKIIVDGNDGTGKSYRCELMRKMFPGISVCDRGLFSRYTLDDYAFNEFSRYNIFKEIDRPDLVKAMSKSLKFNIFRETIQNNKNTLYIILVADPEVCQERIKARGDSIEEKYHTLEDLKFYEDRFRTLIKFVEDLPNIMVIDTTDHKL